MTVIFPYKNVRLLSSEGLPSSGIINSATVYSTIGCRHKSEAIHDPHLYNSSDVKGHIMN